MTKSKKKNQQPKKQNQKQSPKENVNQQQSSKAAVDSSEKEEAASGGLLSNVVGGVTSMVTGAAKAAGLLSASSETTSTETVKPSPEVIKLNSSGGKIGEEISEEKKMPKRSAEEDKGNDGIKEATALSPEEKRQKFEEEGMDPDVAAIMAKMEECSNKQKKKIRDKLRKEDPDLYDRYIKEKTKRPGDQDSGESPEKTKEKEKVDEEEDMKVDKGKDEEEKNANKRKDKEKNTDKKKDCDQMEVNESKKAPVKLSRNTPLLEPSKYGEEDLKVVQEVLETPVNWEDEDWGNNTSKSIEDLKNEEVEEYENELKVASGALPKEHSKVSFGFNKKSGVNDWSEQNEPWTKANKKKDKKDNASAKQENQAKKEENLRPKQEDHQGARAKDGLSKSQKKKQKKQMKMTDYDKYPPGHARYVPESERPQRQPRQHSPGRAQANRSRSNSASRQSPWEPQTIKRSDGSIILQELHGDLFMAPDNYSLVHCVSADFHMGKGIAVQFKKRFGGVGELISYGKY